MFNYTSHLGGTLQLRLIWLFEHTKISYDLYLIITQIRPGFHIYALERSFCLPLYNITMIRHYSRCVIRQLLWLRLHVLIRLCFYIRTTWELTANWLIRDALARSAPGEPANISRDVPLTTDHAISTEAHK